MKNLKKMIVLLLALVMVTALVGCGSKSEIVGTWASEVEGEEMTLEFNDDGTGTMGMMGATIKATYEISGDKLTLTLLMGDDKQTEEFEYKVSGSKLELTADGETQVLKKQ